MYPLYPSLTAASVEFILNNSESKCIVVSNKFQLNKVLKISNKCKYLDFIIVMNENDFDPSVKNLHSFKQVQEMGNEYKRQEPRFFKR